MRKRRVKPHRTDSPPHAPAAPDGRDPTPPPTTPPTHDPPARHTETATELARHLEEHPSVSTVRYPGFSGVISFDVEDPRAVETSTKVILNATSLGGARSTMESRYRWEGDRIPRGLLRFSAGLEDVEALWSDLDQALIGH